MKTEIMIKIEKDLGWTQQQIFNAYEMMHSSDYAEENSDKEEYCVVYDSKLQNKCFDYVEEHRCLTQKN